MVKGHKGFKGFKGSRVQEVLEVARNVEIKARTASLGAIRVRAALLTPVPSEVLQQTDTFFVVPHGRFKVREFADGSGELISYHRSDQRNPKESVYTRYPCHNARDLSETLGQALPVRGRVVKRREVFLIGRSRVHLDEVEGLGCFVELEVVLRDEEAVEHGQHEARDLLRRLDIPETDLVAGAYIDLLAGAPSGEPPHPASATIVTERDDR
jgi:adenylate cyclase class IV